MLFNFPTQDISKVQSWLTPMVARYGIQSITVSYFQHVTTPDSDDIQTINGMNRITVFRDGRVESKTGLQVEQAWGESTIDGHQIMKSEQTMDGNRE